MKVISSQRYLNFEIVDEKVQELQKNAVHQVVLPILDSGVVDGNGEELYILVDGHHRLEAAQELGIGVEFEEIANPGTLTGYDLLDSFWLGDDWYYINNGRLVF